MFRWAATPNQLSGHPALELRGVRAVVARRGAVGAAASLQMARSRGRFSIWRAVGRPRIVNTSKVEIPDVREAAKLDQSWKS